MKHLSPTDPVPVLRGDVVFSGRPTGAGAELVLVRPIGVGSGAQVHGFELSLARMLNGRRTAEEVVNRATRLGLPLSLPALEGFIRFLEQHHLLARSPMEAASAVSPWSERSEWEAGVRLQYQAALTALRGGRSDEARALLDRLLEKAPLLDEARTLRQWLVEHPEAKSDQGETFNETFERAERNWPSRRPPLSRLKGGTTFEEDELRAVRPSFAPMAVLIAIFAIALLALVVPLPRVVSVPAQLVPVTARSIDAPVGGTIGDVRVHEGQQVREGEPLLAYSDPAGTAVEADAEGTVSDLTAAPGHRVVEGQQLLSIEDTRELRLMAHLDPAQAALVRKGQTATIALGQRRVKASITALIGHEIVTTFDNSEGVMEPGNAVLDIDVGSRSFLQRMRK
jgi:biotin carboxyl carrier protein